MENLRPLKNRSLVTRAATVLGLTLLLLAVLLGARPAVAHHAELVASEPKGGETLAQPPTQVRVWFNQRVQVPGSGLAVTDASGNRVDLGETRWGDAEGKELVVDLGSLGPGTYTVIWRTSEIGEDYDEGRFTFMAADQERGTKSLLQLAAALGLAATAFLGVLLVRRSRSD